MGRIEDKLKEMGFTLPNYRRATYPFNQTNRVGNLVFVAGQVASDANGVVAGKLGKDIDVEEGAKRAKLCILNALTALKGELGDLDKIKRIVRTFVMVNGTEEFNFPSGVANGASELLVALFGEYGYATRCAVVMQNLPSDTSVEIEMFVEVED